MSDLSSRICLAGGLSLMFVGGLLGFAGFLGPVAVGEVPGLVYFAICSLLLVVGALVARHVGRAEHFKGPVVAFATVLTIAGMIFAGVIDGVRMVDWKFRCSYQDQAKACFHFGDMLVQDAPTTGARNALQKSCQMSDLQGCVKLVDTFEDRESRQIGCDYLGETYGCSVRVEEDDDTYGPCRSYFRVCVD